MIRFLSIEECAPDDGGDGNWPDDAIVAAGCWPAVEIDLLGNNPEALSPTEATLCKRANRIALGAILEGMNDDYAGTLLDAIDDDGGVVGPCVTCSDGVIVEGYPFEVAWPDGEVTRRPAWDSTDP